MKRLIKYRFQMPLCVCSAIAMCLSPAMGHAQELVNYVLTEKQIGRSTARQKNYQFYDGLGRLIQSASNGVNDNGAFVYSQNEITGEGQLRRRWLPIVGDTKIESMGHDAIVQASSVQYADGYAFESMGYDALERLRTQSRPGSDWLKKHANISHVTNSRGEFVHYAVNTPKGGLATIISKGDYEAGTLYGTCVTNEDGLKITAYTNVVGQKIIERKGNGNDTYYVYDDFGRLNFVLMPGYKGNNNLDKYAYQYRYSLDGNLIYKKLPGCEPIEYVYDKNDHCLAVQDGELKKKGLYRFMLYDAVGRMVLQGLSTTKPDGTGEATVTLDENEEGIEETGYHILNDANLNLTIKDIEVVNYYDNYRFTEGWYADFFLGLIPPTTDNARGRLSGSAVLTSNGGRLGCIISYDQQGNVLEIQKKGLDGSVDLVTNTYTYTNQLASSKSMVKIEKGDTLKFEEHNTYSATTDRLVAITRQAFLNAFPSKMNKCTYTYDRLGRLVAIDRPINRNKGKINYEYNIQSWTQKINSDSFNESIHYVDGQGKPMYSGNISSITWRDSNSGQTNRGYRYTYDDLNRLVNAEYGENNFSTGIGRYNEGPGYDGNSNVTSLQRKGMTQEGSYGLIDDLRLGYDGNQLSKVEENAPAVLYAGSLDVKHSTSDIHYNANGSLTMDGTRDITHIDYDLHNNPLRIQFANGNVTKYVYSATGEKLRTIHYTAMPNTHVEMGQVYADIEKRCLAVDSTDYHLGGNAILVNGKFQTLLFEGGYVALAHDYFPPACVMPPMRDPSMSDEFFAKLLEQWREFSGKRDNYSIDFVYFNLDHLGNVREVVSEKGEVEQVNAYYPFGTPIYALGTNESQQRYKYNGKEFDELHGLNTYDYGARQYAPLLPMWDRVDPLAEKYYGVSPYAYCLGNPINHIDYEGSKVVTVLYVDDGAVPTRYYQSPKHFADGMRILAQTEFGRKILADFTHKGSYIFGVKGNGKYSDFKLRIQEDLFVEYLERRSIFHKHDGAWIQAQTTLQEGNDGKPEFRILFDINYSLEELIETIIHEFALHLSKYEKVISAYKRNGSYKDAEEEWNRSPEKIEHHDLIDSKRGKKLPGTRNYEKTKGEVIKNYPNLKDIFEDEMREYERRY